MNPELLVDNKTKYRELCARENVETGAGITILGRPVKNMVDALIKMAKDVE